MRKAAFIILILAFFACGNVEKANQAMEKGSTYLDDGDVEEAIGQFKLAIKNYKKEGNLSKAHFKLGLAYAARNNSMDNKNMELYDSTIVNFDYALRHAATNEEKAEILDKMGLVKTLVGDKNGAIMAYKQIPEYAVGPNKKANALMNAAMIFRDIGDLKSAITDFEAALESTDNSEIKGICHREIGEIETIRGNYEKAIEVLGQALIISPNNEEKGLACISMAYTYEKQGKFKNAIEKYEQGIRLLNKPMNLTDAFNGLGAVYFQMQEYQKADSLFAKALKIAPMNAQRNLNYGFTRLYLGEIDDAFKYFEAAIKLDERLKRTIAQSGEIHRWLKSRVSNEKKTMVREKLNKLVKPMVISERK